MTLVQLKHLIELANSGSFSLSALKLHLTQPALSRSIKALEPQLRNALTEDILAQYIARVQDELGVSINEAAVRLAVGVRGSRGCGGHCAASLSRFFQPPPFQSPLLRNVGGLWCSTEWP